MKVQPKSEKELAIDPLPDGVYPFTCIASGEIPSKSEKNKGRLMFAVKLNVHGPDGDRHVYDYFADWFSEWKLRHFAETTGQLQSYEAGALDGADGAFINRAGYVKLFTERSDRFADKNAVKDYITKAAVAGSPVEPAKAAPASADENPDWDKDVGF